MAPESIPAIDELVAYLALCPEASVNVEGHTDADGEAEADAEVADHEAPCEAAEAPGGAAEVAGEEFGARCLCDDGEHVG